MIKPRAHLSVEEDLTSYLFLFLMCPSSGSSAVGSRLSFADGGVAWGWYSDRQCECSLRLGWCSDKRVGCSLQMGECSDQYGWCADRRDWCSDRRFECSLQHG